MTSIIIVLLIKFLGNIYLLNKTIEFDISQYFYKAFSNHLFSWNVEKLDFLGGYLIVDIIKLNLDMLYLKVKYWIVFQYY